MSDCLNNLYKGNPCPYKNEICHNTEGSFYCDCEEGYQEQCSSNNNRLIFQDLNFRFKCIIWPFNS